MRFCNVISTILRPGRREKIGECRYRRSWGSVIFLKELHRKLGVKLWQISNFYKILKTGHIKNVFSNNCNPWPNSQISNLRMTFWIDFWYKLHFEASMQKIAVFAIWCKILNFKFLSYFDEKWLSFSNKPPKVPQNSIYGHYDQSIISFSMNAWFFTIFHQKDVVGQF